MCIKKYERKCLVLHFVEFYVTINRTNLQELINIANLDVKND